MGIKEKNALKPGRRDKVIMEEIEALITDFGFNINQFVEYACEMDVAIFSPNKGALDKVQHLSILYRPSGPTARAMEACEPSAEL